MTKEVEPYPKNTQNSTKMVFNTSPTNKEYEIMNSTKKEKENLNFIGNIHHNYFIYNQT